MCDECWSRQIIEKIVRSIHIKKIWWQAAVGWVVVDVQNTVESPENGPLQNDTPQARLRLQGGSRD